MKTRITPHTKAPWEDNGNGLIYGQVSADDDEAPFVADVCRDGASGLYSDEERANARLIAAAPTLLARLRAVAELRRRWRGGDEAEAIDRVEYADGLDALGLDDAIAEATGRRPSRRPHESRTGESAIERVREVTEPSGGGRLGEARECPPPDPDGMNDARSSWADSALRAFRRETGTDREDALGDLLGDLMHWSDREGYDFELALDRARDHYRAETTPDDARNRPAELGTPWALHFERDGTEDVAVIRDSEGHDLATSRHFWLAREDDPVPPTLASLRLMAAAPLLLEALDRLLERTVDQDLKHGITLGEGEQEARARALAAIALAKEGVP